MTVVVIVVLACSAVGLVAWYDRLRRKNAPPATRSGAGGDGAGADNWFYSHDGHGGDGGGDGGGH